MIRIQLIPPFIFPSQSLSAKSFKKECRILNKILLIYLIALSNWTLILRQEQRLNKSRTVVSIKSRPLWATLDILWLYKPEIDY